MAKLMMYRAILITSLASYLVPSQAANQPYGNVVQEEKIFDQLQTNLSKTIKTAKRNIDSDDKCGTNLLESLQKEYQLTQENRQLKDKTLELERQLVDFQCYQPTGEISLEPEEPQPIYGNDIQLATDNNTELKKTHHHYCGFYSKKILPEIDGPVKIMDKIYYFTKELIMDVKRSANDVIMTLKNVIETTDEIKIGTLVKDMQNRIVSVVTTKIDNKYLIQNSFKHLNIHLSNTSLQFQTKVKPICYADKQFVTKEELVDYLNKPNKTKTPVTATVFHRDRKQAQLIVHKDGHNILNQHIRHAIYDPDFQNRERMRDILNNKIHDPCKISKLSIKTNKQYMLLQQLATENITYLSMCKQDQDLINKALEVAYKANRTD
jgi:hypothetical protein